MFLYEDHGTAEPFAYYRPGQPYRLISQSFGTTGANWTESGLRAEMDRAPAGFWLVLFLTTSDTRAEFPHIVRWARANWNVETYDSARPLHVLRCRSQ